MSNDLMKMIITGLLLMAASLNVEAGGELKLNHVWSRIADINGELGSVESSEFSPDSRHIATGSKYDNTVRVFRTADGHQMWSTTLPQEIERVAWTRDGRFVCSVSEDGMLRVFDVASQQLVFSYEHANGIDGMAASHNGRYMVTGREKLDSVGIARVFNTADWSIEQELKHPGTINEIDFTYDDKYMVTVGDFAMRVWRTSDWSVHAKFDLESSRYFEPKKVRLINAKFSPDGNTLAVGGKHGYVFFFDVESGELIRRLNKTGRKTETVAWTKDGRYFLAAGYSNTIDFFATKHILDKAVDNDSLPFAFRQPVTDHLEYMDFNQQGTFLTTAHQDGTVQLWTFMSDDPLINKRRHREVRKLQDRLAEEAGKKTF